MSEHSIILLMFDARWSEHHEEELRNSRIHTTQQLAQAVKEAARPPKVFVSTSAVGRDLMPGGVHAFWC